MDIVQLSRGSKKQVVEAATSGTTYKGFNSRGHNAIIIYAFISGTGQWDVSLNAIDGYGNSIAIKDINGNVISFSNLTSSDSRCFIGIPDKFEFVTNEDSGTSTLSLSYELLTI